jgi:hypothetical protein
MLLIYRYCHKSKYTNKKINTKIYKNIKVEYVHLRILIIIYNDGEKLFTEILAFYPIRAREHGRDQFV